MIEIKVKVDKVTIFNPMAGAFCEVSIENAEKFIESAKELEKKIKELKGEAETTTEEAKTDETK